MKKNQRRTGFAAAVSLIAGILVSFTPASASPTTVLQPPRLSLTSGSGSFVAVPATWSSAVKSSYAWLVGGKPVKGATSLKYKAVLKKGTAVQFKEVANGVAALSNTIVTGSVAVNGYISIGYADTEKTKLSATLPATFPSKAQVSYQWFVGPFEVKGAHDPTYTLSTGDQGADVSLAVTFTAKGYLGRTATSNTITIPVTPRTYQMTWSEEFNPGSGLDTSIWSPENGDGTAFRNRGWGNQERQWYLQEQSAVDSSGALVQTATRTGASAYKCYYGTPCEWISSKLVTKNKVGFKYGRIEARIKGPLGVGTWGAFWMLGANIDERPWPGCGEIDITEFVGRDPSTVYGTPHGPASGQSNTTTLDGGYSDSYHTYAIDWLPDQITWYLDGKAYGTLNRSSLDDPAHTWVFDHEFYLLVNLAMGGTFGGAIDDNLKSATMSVDYIRFSTINGIGQVIQH